MVVTTPPAAARRRRTFAQWMDHLPAVWSLPASHAKDVCAVLLILAIPAISAYIGIAHIRLFGHDTFVLLDSGWRVLNGQRPALDFASGIAPLTSLIMAAGMRIAHNSVRGIGYASALVAAVTGLWSYLLSRGRMAWIPAVLASFALALLAATPFPLGLPANDTSYAMAYNRYGYALLGIVMLDAFLACPPPRRREFFGGISSGALAVILLFLKPSYGLVAFVFVGYSASRGWRKGWRPLGFAVGLAAAFLEVMAFLRFDFAPVWNDFRMLAGARGSLLNFWELPWALTKNVPEVLSLILLAMLVVAVRSSAESGLRPFEPLILAALAVLGQAALLATNAQPGGYPLIGVLALILAEQGRVAFERRETGSTPGFLRADTVILLAGLLCFGSTFAADAGGLWYALVQSRKNPLESEVARFQAPHLAPLLLYEAIDGSPSALRSNGRAYVDYVNGGVDLIRKVSGENETVYTLDSRNPFSYALLRRPAPGGAPSMDFRFQFNDEFKPSPERLFDAADIVMVPKYPSASEPTTQALLRNYLPAVQAGYRLCAESDWWWLYKRPANLRGCPTEPQAK